LTRRLERALEARQHGGLGARHLRAQAKDAPAGARDPPRALHDLGLQALRFLGSDLLADRPDEIAPGVEQLLARAMLEPRLQQSIRGRALGDAGVARVL